MRIDAHQHFWKLDRGDYGWLTSDLAPIYRDFLPQDLDATLAKHGIDGTVLVQAAPTLAETEFMLSLAAQTPFIKGVVGWVDFDSPEGLADMRRLATNPALVGLRPMIQDIADTNWMLRDDASPAFDALTALDLTFDALTLPQHLKNLRRLLHQRADMRVVIDHASKPLIADGIIDGWAADMTALAKDTNAFCKLSGMVTEAGADWTAAQLKPYVDHLLATFGPERLIWGSDWPVCTLASTYDAWVEATDTLLQGLTQQQRDAVLGGNARKAYKLVNIA
ncbi:amidohydrolase [Cognatishimia sp.]|uniref:amidohydrolase family protein n=1 Tax=Cognatishimia sp. TaxID=2211648 RepID=UPI00351265AC